MTINCPTQSTPTTLIHECFGFNLMERIDEYVKPNLTKTSTLVFNSIQALQNQINSQTDHGGAVYQLAGGTYNVTSTAISIEDRRNLCIYADPNSPVIINGNNSANYGVLIRDNGTAVQNVEIMGFVFDNFAGHGIFVGSDNAGQRGGENIRIMGNTVINSSNNFGAGILIRDDQGRGGPYLIECNTIRDIASTNVNTGTNNRGEGIYIGSGNDEDRWAQNVTIRGNTIYNLRAEGIDVKRASRNITIHNNHIYNVQVSSQGAVVLGLDHNKPEDNYDANIQFYRNCVHDVSTRAFNGNGVTAHLGRTDIYENIIFNTAAEAISVYADCNEINDNISIVNNILWNYGGGQPVEENGNSGNGGPFDNCNITRMANIVQNNSKPTECQETASIFVGPLSTCEGFAPAS